ncbi:hypothetical protein E1A91_D12G186800v1, partial [Gossypium mustelinum]
EKTVWKWKTTPLYFLMPLIFWGLFGSLSMLKVMLIIPLLRFPNFHTIIISCQCSMFSVKTTLHYSLMPLIFLEALQFPLNAESDDGITPTTIPKLSHTLSMLHIFTEDGLIHVAELEDDAPPVVADDILSMLHNF